MLFATEGFESFNAIIRTHSIHSNRQSPSRDIAQSMARANRIRHLISGGFFRVPPEDTAEKSKVESSEGRCTAASLIDGLSPWMWEVNQSANLRWTSIGPGVRSMLHTNRFSFKVLGFEDDTEEEAVDDTAKSEGKPCCFEIDISTYSSRPLWNS